MPNLPDHPVTRRWPARNPAVLQLYSLPTPNGVKIGVALEELGLPYEAHLVNFGTDDQFTPEFLALNPNNKIPAILDPDGPGGQPIALFESGAILLYLADKTGKLMPRDPVARWHTIQWLMWQMGGVGPMFGQLGYFHSFAGKEIEDKRPHERYRAEVERLLKVLDGQLAGRDWVMGDDFTIADIAIAPWVRTLLTHYQAEGLVGWQSLRHVPAWFDRFMARPAVQRGVNVPPRP
ncbi:MAG: glutathione S-transferase N-terminal domain-containing protein [Rhodobacteraceae bacterium]|jgi:GST-like protein|nr:glutathione S-transferase N-terminal domain-containing protein [Paracoccaceae bacterium]